MAHKHTHLALAATFAVLAMTQLSLVQGLAQDVDSFTETASVNMAMAMPLKVTSKPLIPHSFSTVSGEGRPQDRSARRLELMKLSSANAVRLHSAASDVK